MKINKLYATGTVCALAGLLAGWLLTRSAAPTEISHEHEHEETAAEVWSCSMHPQIRQDHPGRCPLCDMDLTLLSETFSYEEDIPEDAVVLSKEAMALAEIRTVAVSRSKPVKDIFLYGTVQADERLVRSQVSHFSGRIEKLYINYAGETVTVGQTIASVHSPELINARRELLEALRLSDKHPELLAAARSKLRLLKLTDAQIAAVESSGEAETPVEITATVGGTVTERKVSQGDYISQGSPLYEVSDLSRVWIVFEAYEKDLPYVNKGDELEYTLPAFPDSRFKGRIEIIEPSVDPSSRTVKLRVSSPNPRLELKPLMYAQANIRAKLRNVDDAIVIPSSAVLWTGARSIVYVRDLFYDRPVFQLRQVELGAALGDSYVVLSGLEEDEEIVISGAFAVDATAQLEGKASMMNM